MYDLIPSMKSQSGRTEVKDESDGSATSPKNSVCHLKRQAILFVTFNVFYRIHMTYCHRLHHRAAWLRLRSTQTTQLMTMYVFYLCNSISVTIFPI